MKLRYILGVLFLLISVMYSQPVTAGKFFTSLPIGTNFYYIDNASSNWSLDDVIQSTDWKQSTDNFLHQSIKPNIIWMKFYLVNNTGKNLYLSTDYPKYDRITFYRPSGKGTYISVKTGNQNSFKKRDVNDVNFTFFIPPVPQAMYYMKIQMINFPFQIYPRLMTAENYYKNKISRNWHFLLYLSFMGFLLLFSLLYLFLTKEKEFLFQILYILSWLLFQISFLGYGFKYLWKEAFFIDKYIFILSMHCIGILTALLYRYYLNLQKDWPEMDRYITKFILYPIIILLLLVFFLPYRVLLRLSLLMALYTMISEFVLGIILIKRKKFLAVLLFIGFLGVQIGAGLSILGAMHIVTIWPIMQWGSFIGNIWIILFLFLTLALKYQIFKRRLKESEKQLNISHFAIDNGLDLALWIKENGNIIYANKTAYRLLGYTEEELINKIHPWNIIKNVTEEDWKQLWQQLRKEKKLIRDFELVTKTGSYISVETHANYLIYENEEYNFAFMHDVREKRRQEKEIKDKERHLSITLNSIGDGVIVTDTKGYVIRMNPVAERLTGWNFSEAEGKNLEEVFRIINRDSLEKVENPVKKVLETGKIVGLANHTVLVSKKGEQYHIADSGAPIKEEDSSIIGVVIVFRDVTEEYNLQIQLQHAQTLESLGQLAGGVAHDFNNILTGIMANAELIQSSCEEKDVLKMTDSIIHLAERGGSLSKNLLVLSKKNEMNTEKINLTEILKDIVDILEHTIDKKIQIYKDFRIDKKLYIIGDSSQIHSAILNIALNARDSIQTKGEIHFSLSEEYLSSDFCKQHIIDNSEGMYAVLSITDTGTGIAKKDFRKIFEPFFTTKPMGHGTGLGLSLTYSTVKQHKGGINVYSEEGKGTTFKLYFKLTETESADKQKSSSAEKGTGHILIVDDEENILMVLEKMLTKLGYTVTAVGSSDTALQYFNEHYKTIDIVLLDYILPQKNGLEIYEEMKKKFPNVKAVLMSGFSRNLKQEDMIQAGIKDFISKPFKLAELSEKIKKVMNSE